MATNRATGMIGKCLNMSKRSLQATYNTSWFKRLWVFLNEPRTIKDYE